MKELDVLASVLVVVGAGVVENYQPALAPELLASASITPSLEKGGNIT